MESAMGPQIGDNILNGRYKILAEVKGHAGRTKTTLGRPGLCRFCGSTDLGKFRNVAHTFPESLGNKCIVSADECDDCNSLFSIYDDALANCIGPILTLGGVKGKGNKVRQSGRTAGNSVINRHSIESIPQISLLVRGIDGKKQLKLDPATGMLKLNFPLPAIPYKPRHAYKAVVKMAIALLPESELSHFGKLREWLRQPNAGSIFSRLPVGISFASIGKWPQLVAGMLLKRTIDDEASPYMIFLCTAGSVCLQIHLMSDDMDKRASRPQPAQIAIEWTTILAGSPVDSPIRLDFGTPTQLDWESIYSRSQPIKSMDLHFDPVTTHGSFHPNFRKTCEDS
jgi:hypothetical protein